MSITVQFSISAKKDNSTAIPVMRDSAECTFKNGCSMLSPTLLLNIRTDTFPDYTFFKIENRIYKVTDIRSVRNDLFEIDGTVDVLATYKTEIGASTQYVVRSASASNGKVMDKKYPTIADTDEVHINLTNISSQIPHPFSAANGTYVLGLKSKITDSGIAYYALNASQFASFVDFLYDGNWLDATEVSNALQKMLVDPFDYIISCNWYPFTITGNSTQVYFGYWDWTGVTMQQIPESDRIKSLTHSDQLPNHPQISRGSYLNASPYTQITIDAYTFGRFPIDANRFLDDRSIIVSIGIDLFTGIGTIRITGTTGIIFESSATCAIPIELSQVRNDPLKPLVGAATAGMSLAKENYVGALKGIADTVENSMPQLISMGAVGSITAYAYNEPLISCVFYNITEEYNTDIGRPLMSPRIISSLSGYIECENAEIELSATKYEIEEVIRYLNNGFFYE